MRTTITLTPEAESVIRRMMDERKLSFKEAVNSAILSAPRHEARERYVLPSFTLGTRVPLDDIKGLLGQLDDEDYLRKQEFGK
ncbi:hypothetical protein [Microbacterium elymi]|uniref:Antitoxin n=1 Tax=Microbacterium elymi TaxID=2909587 RepID=A0ABY5NH50_9MICO|nr:MULTISPECIES: hypothetical protein [Microbacterium]UUT34451.1 hypothetical protein L2X98_28075 [Microbacterium elymi]